MAAGYGETSGTESAQPHIWDFEDPAREEHQGLLTDLSLDAIAVPVLGAVTNGGIAVRGAMRENFQRIGRDHRNPVPRVAPDPRLGAEKEDRVPSKAPEETASAKAMEVRRENLPEPEKPMASGTGKYCIEVLQDTIVGMHQTNPLTGPNAWKASKGLPQDSVVSSGSILAAETMAGMFVKKSSELVQATSQPADRTVEAAQRHPALLREWIRDEVDRPSGVWKEVMDAGRGLDIDHGDSGEAATDDGYLTRVVDDVAAKFLMLQKDPTTRARAFQSFEYSPEEKRIIGLPQNEIAAHAVNVTRLEQQYSGYLNASPFDREQWKPFDVLRNFAGAMDRRFTTSATHHPRDGFQYGGSPITEERLRWISALELHDRVQHGYTSDPVNVLSGYFSKLVQLRTLSAEVAARAVYSQPVAEAEKHTEEIITSSIAHRMVMVQRREGDAARQEVLRDGVISETERRAAIRDAMQFEFDPNARQEALHGRAHITDEGLRDQITSAACEYVVASTQRGGGGKREADPQLNQAVQNILSYLAGQGYAHGMEARENPGTGRRAHGFSVEEMTRLSLPDLDALRSAVETSRLEDWAIGYLDPDKHTINTELARRAAMMELGDAAAFRELLRQREADAAAGRKHYMSKYENVLIISGDLQGARPGLLHAIHATNGATRQIDSIGGNSPARNEEIARVWRQAARLRGIDLRVNDPLPYKPRGQQWGLIQAEGVIPAAMINPLKLEESLFSHIAPGGMFDISATENPELTESIKAAISPEMGVFSKSSLTGMKEFMWINQVSQRYRFRGVLDPKINRWQASIVPLGPETRLIVVGRQPTEPTSEVLANSTQLLIAARARRHALGATKAE